MTSRVTAIAPSSTANIGPGFDVFGLALDAFFDKVMIEQTEANSIRVEVSGEHGNMIPLEPEANAAGLVVKNMNGDHPVDTGLKIIIEKGVPAGYGLGSSAASASAAAVAFNEMSKLNLSRNELVRYAATGEIASAGTAHYDNVSASLLGGFVIVRTDPLNVVNVDAPKDLAICVAVPKIDVPKKKTEVARSILPEHVTLRQTTINLANACSMVAGFILGDIDLIAKSINDVIVEPARKHLIPGYDQVRTHALDAGALAVTISGAGPSLIAFAKYGNNIEKICEAMREGFRTVNVESQVISCKPSNGARIV